MENGTAADKAARMAGKAAVRTAVLFAALFAIGLATRFPALQFPHLYALHGILAAPFFSALALWHFNREGSVWSLFAAVAALAAVLGCMSPVMGLGFLLLAALLLAADALLRSCRPARRRLGCAVAFGALDYPCALAVGLLLGSYAFSLESLPTILVLGALAAALSLLGALPFAKAK